MSGSLGVANEISVRISILQTCKNSLYLFMWQFYYFAKFSLLIGHSLLEIILSNKFKSLSYFHEF